MTVLRYVFPLCLPKLKAPIYPINYCYCYEALVKELYLECHNHARCTRHLSVTRS